MLGVETTGVESDEGKEWFEIIEEKLKTETGDPKSKFYLIQTIIRTTQSGNAASIVSSWPPAEGIRDVLSLLFINSLLNFH